MSDENGRFELTRRRLLGSLAVTGAATAGAGAGTWAYFQDTESSTGNSVQAGTLELTYSNSGDFSYTITGVAPGDGMGATTLDTINTTLSHGGSIPADHVEIDVNNRPMEDANGDLSDDDSGPESDSMPNSADGMAEYVAVKDLTYKFTDGSQKQYVDDGQPTSAGTNRGITDQNGNSRIDLDDLDVLSDQDTASKPKLDDFEPPTPSGGTTDFRLSVGVHPDMPNDYQGDVLLTDVTISLHQDASQNRDLDP